MNKILIIPDSFKGSISSQEFCDIVRETASSHFPKAEILAFPVADGGEGSVHAFLAAAGGERVELSVKGPHFEEIVSFYGRLENGDAVIEMAAAAGLPLTGNNGKVMEATTYGVGQLIEHAVSQGARKIIIGLGGSATNDAGAGALAALGVRFYDSAGISFIPTGGTLGKIARICRDTMLPGLLDTEIIAMCDVGNPLCGPSGAAFVFGPQKGADGETVRLLDHGLAHFAEVISHDLNTDITRIPGAGAAGGMGGGLVAVLGARLQMGIDTVLDVIGFDDLLNGADLVLTGEGNIDGQSMRGKVVIGVAKRAKQAGVPTIAIVGGIGDNIGEAYDMGVTAIFSTNRRVMSMNEAYSMTKENLRLTTGDLMRTINAFGQ